MEPTSHQSEIQAVTIETNKMFFRPTPRRIPSSLAHSFVMLAAFATGFRIGVPAVSNRASG